jgi:hypothetical protein
MSYPQTGSCRVHRQALSQTRLDRIRASIIENGGTVTDADLFQRGGYFQQAVDVLTKQGALMPLGDRLVVASGAKPRRRTKAPDIDPRMRTFLLWVHQEQVVGWFPLRWRGIRLKAEVAGLIELANPIGTTAMFLLSDKGRQVITAALRATEPPA